LARKAGHPLERLIFFAKPGAQARCRQPGTQAITKWFKKTSGINVEIREFTPPQVEQILDEPTET
jgi:hypothetical protein